MNILYARGNYTKKPKFRIQTVIYREGNSYIVRKQAQNPEAKAAIQSLIKFDSRLESLFPNISFVPLQAQGDDWAEYEYIQAPTLERKIEESILARAFGRADELVSQGFNIIHRFPQKELDPYSQSGYRELFDQETMFQTGATEPCVNPVLFDLNLDNMLLLPEDDIRIIDREWVFEFPVPVAFIKFQTLFYLSVGLQNIIRKFTCSAFPVIEVFRNMYIPKSWFDISGVGQTNISRWVAAMINFQNTVNWKQFTTINLEPLTNMTVVTSLARNPFTEALERTIMEENEDYIQGRLKELAHKNNSLHEQIQQTEKEIHSLESAIQQITGSKFYRIARKIKLI